MADTRSRVWSVAGLLAAATLSSGLLTAAAEAAESGTASTAAPPIVGGQQAKITDYPWVVYLTDTQGNQFCGGTVAKANKIITAAHCVSGEKPESVQVVAGREDKQQNDGAVVKVSGIWVNPNYQDANTGADVAVLTLAQDLQQQPLAVASKDDTALYAAGKTATTLGWGATAEGGQASQTLQKADVPLTSDDDCKKAYSQYNAEAMVCAGFPQGGVDACQGDSGGPLVVENKLVGIVSTGNGCARPNAPGIYTRVATYHDEVQKQLDS
ncbi:serine protease [Saccharopolyspora sp. WRP15-2]|uniref:Serine protease n=1 Tax=Saccharopolyspora oryzae TaxID=2997343 RepID=A0ABT4V640_9PSEU|nr:serine protease [Saccharopolyspora oryzae]MDA3629435.1 serine protease [Saccharopolyspora oryzae]